MKSKITLTGMYNFDNSLFDELTFPTGIDRDLAISRILNKSEEFELLYSDFDYLKDRIGIWAKIWERTFTKWVNALSIDYDPLFNFDRNEEYTDTRGREYNDKRNDIENSNASASSASTSNTVTGSSSGSTTEQKVSAYDSSSYSEKEKEEGSAHTSQTGSGDSTASTESTSNNIKGSDASGTSNEIVKHAAHLYGNIGVTTSQQMLKDELDVATWNLYEHISDIFIDEFCILVY